jgi:hypothetical protein
VSGVSVAAFGLSRGIFVAHALQQKVGENANPWPAVDAAFAAPVAVLPKGIAPRHERTRSNLEGLSAERKAYLRLLSRFELPVSRPRCFTMMDLVAGLVGAEQTAKFCRILIVSSN